jgi:hypothetical protein
MLSLTHTNVPISRQRGYSEEFLIYLLALEDWKSLHNVFPRLLSSAYVLDGVNDFVL